MHPKPQNQNLKTPKTPMMLTVWIASLTLHQTLKDYHELMKLLKSSYAIGNMLQVSLSQLTTITHCMSKACFDKLQPKPVLVHTHTYKVNGVNGNSLSLPRMTTCTLEFPKKVPTTVHSIWTPLTCHFGPDLSHNFLFGIDWFSTNQLHLHQGPQSIVVSDPALFPLHVNQISTLPPPHILVKTISQVTIPSRTLAIDPTTFNSKPKPDCYYNFTEMPHKSQQNLFVVPVLKFLAQNYQYTFCVQS